MVFLSLPFFDMRSLSILAAILVLPNCVAAQAICDIWVTTWDRSNLFTRLSLSEPIEFMSFSNNGSITNINLDDSTVYQTVLGFGGSLTDSSAFILNNLKATNPDNYWNLLKYLFDTTDGANAAGLSYMRIPLGASDFSPREYSFDDVDEDREMSGFDMNNAPPYLFSVLQDIQSLTKILHVHLVPWSPPRWMKDSGSMKGGSLKPDLVNAYAMYLLKCLQGFVSLGIRPYAISVQNEPQYSNPTYPTASFTPAMEGQVARALREAMQKNGLTDIKLIGYEHNWDTAGGYPVQLMETAGDAFDGVAFHCYRQDQFFQQFPDKELYFTECSGTFGSDWWNDIKWYMDNIFIAHNSRSGLMWNIALDGNGGPKLPGTNSCGGPGCRGIVQVDLDGTYTINQEYYAMAHASKAIIPKDQNGPFGQRMKVDVDGGMSWALRVSAIGGWNPQPVQAAIRFQGKQAVYTFPVGVTTLWWYTPPVRNQRRANETHEWPGLYTRFGDQHFIYS
ncbi:glycoside hydrolase family 30 protein [Amanita rubescens]|nr:glycoside hydrolase family 30 protein [Amanita rubescens]